MCCIRCVRKVCFVSVVVVSVVLGILLWMLGVWLVRGMNRDESVSM